MDNVNKIHFKKLAEMVRDEQLKPMEKILMVNLLLYAGLNGQAFPSQKQLGLDLGCSSRYIRQLLTSLNKRGLLNWTRRGYGKSNLYNPIEELYFRNDKGDRNYSSPNRGIEVPNQRGAIVPTNVSNKLINSTNENKYKNLSDVSEVDITEISEQYKVPIGLVKMQLEALNNYCASTGKKYKNYKAALRNFVLREAKNTVERRAQYGNKRGIDARSL